MYFPLYTYDKDMGLGYDGMKLRALIATPNAADRKVEITPDLISEARGPARLQLRF